MGLFDRNKDFSKKRSIRTDIELNITNIVVLLILSLVAIQAFGILFGDIFDINITLGPVFILLAAGMSAAMSIAIFRKVNRNTQVSKKDVFAIVIVTLLTLLMMFYLRDVVPEVFEQSFIQLQSIIGI